MSTVTEIREAIARLDGKERSLLLAELFSSSAFPHEGDAGFLASLDEAQSDVNAGRVHSVEEVRAMIPEWISGSSSPKER